MTMTSGDSKLFGLFSPIPQDDDRPIAKQYGIPSKLSYLEAVSFLQDTQMMPHLSDDTVAYIDFTHTQYQCRVNGTSPIAVGDKVCLVPPRIPSDQVHSHYHFPILMALSDAKYRHLKMLESCFCSLISDEIEWDDQEVSSSEKDGIVKLLFDEKPSLLLHIYAAFKGLQLITEGLKPHLIEYLQGNQDIIPDVDTGLLEVVINDLSKSEITLSTDKEETKIIVRNNLNTGLDAMTKLVKCMSPKVIGTVEKLENKVQGSKAVNGDYVLVRMYEM